MPQLNNIFQVNAATVEFKSDPSVTDAKMDFVGVPDNVDGDAAEFGGAVGSFKEWLRQMIRWSNNLAASKCIDALGYFYINGLLRSAGVFVPDAVIPRTGEGLWISADYEKHDWVSNADDKLRNAAGPRLTTRWANAQHRDRSNLIANAFQTTRLMAMMATDRLVESDTAHSNPCGEMRELLAAAIAPIGPKSGIGSYIKDALNISPKKPFDAIQAKKGYGDDKSSHERGMVERTVGAKKLRYVAVVLGSLVAAEQQDLRDTVRMLDDVVVAINP